MIHADLRKGNPQLMANAKDCIVQTLQPCRVKNAMSEINNLNMINVYPRHTCNEGPNDQVVSTLGEIIIEDMLT